jgi:hypothetical protein
MFVMFPGCSFLLHWFSVMALLKTLPLFGKIRGQDIFQSFYASFVERNVPILKPVSTTTEGAPAMTSKIVRLIRVRSSVSLSSASST